MGIGLMGILTRYLKVAHPFLSSMALSFATVMILRLRCQWKMVSKKWNKNVSLHFINQSTIIIALELVVWRKWYQFTWLFPCIFDLMFVQIEEDQRYRLDHRYIIYMYNLYLNCRHETVNKQIRHLIKSPLSPMYITEWDSQQHKAH